MMKYEILLVTKMFLAVFTLNLGFGAVLWQKLKIFPKRLVSKSAFWQYRISKTLALIFHPLVKKNECDKLYFLIKVNLTIKIKRK